MDNSYSVLCGLNLEETQTLLLHVKLPEGENVIELNTKDAMVWFEGIFETPTWDPRGNSKDSKRHSIDIFMIACGHLVSTAAW